jgi:hypothetical protein
VYVIVITLFTDAAVTCAGVITAVPGPNGVLVGVAVGVDVGDAVGVDVLVGVAGITLTAGEVLIGAVTSPDAALSTTNTALPAEACT